MTSLPTKVTRAKDTILTIKANTVGKSKTEIQTGNHFLKCYVLTKFYRTRIYLFLMVKI